MKMMIKWMKTKNRSLMVTVCFFMGISFHKCGDSIDLNDWNDWGHNCGAPKFAGTAYVGQ